MALVVSVKLKYLELVTQLKVKVTHVDVDERLVDFQIVGMRLTEK